MQNLPDLRGLPGDLDAVLASAARLQQVVPEAVLVGGSAAALYAHHRTSFDHDHVLPDLAERYSAVLEAVEATDGWATNVRASTPPFTLLGTLDDIEAGLRQLRRRRPLEVTSVTLAGDASVAVPTFAEILRVKAYLVVQRNAVRDYLDVAALTAQCGVDTAAQILVRLDDYYRDRSADPTSVLSALTERLAGPAPRDSRVIAQLGRYKALDRRWQDWDAVREICGQVAVALVDAVEGQG